MSVELITKILDFPRIRNISGPILNLGADIEELFFSFSVPKDSFFHFAPEDLSNQGNVGSINIADNLESSLPFHAATAFFTFSAIPEGVAEELLYLSYRALLGGSALYVWDVEFFQDQQLEDVKVTFSLPNGMVAAKDISKASIKNPLVSNVLLPICSRIGFMIEKKVEFGGCGLFLKLRKQRE